MNQIFSKKLSGHFLENLRAVRWYRHGIYKDGFVAFSTNVRSFHKESFRHCRINRSISRIIVLETGEVYLDDKEGEDIVQEMYRKISSDRNFLQEYYDGHMKINRRLVSMGRYIAGRNVSVFSDEGITQFFIRYLKDIEEYFQWLWSMEFLNTAVDAYIRDQIKRYEPDWSAQRINNFLLDISHIHKKLYFQREKADVVQCSLTRERKKTLYKKYAWLNMSLWSGRPYSMFEYEKRLSEVFNHRKELQAELKINEGLAKKALRLIRSLPHQRLREELKIIRDLIYLKSIRIDYATRSWSLVLPLVEEYCKRHFLTLDNFLKLTADEVLNPGGYNLQEQSSSRSLWALTTFNYQTFHFYASDAQEIRGVLERVSRPIKASVSGICGYKGKVVGTIKVLLTHEDLYKIKKGDILVSNLTNPNYDPAFSKIVAVITDEGGVLCHTAIMAREFKIPCIIGTKIATKVLKDGDLVEVDAERGVVKILERAGNVKKKL